jgi:hypothetical protein
MKKFFYIAIVLALFSAELPADQESKGKKTYRLNWEEVEGAIRYQIQIKERETIVLDKQVESNSASFAITPGKYRIRIGAINKFEKVGRWSAWEEITVAESEYYDQFVRGRNLLGLGIKVSAGISYFQLQPEWNSVYQNSSVGLAVNVAYPLGHLPPFSSFGILRYTGLEIETNRVTFPGKDDPDRIQSDLTSTFTGGNIYFMTNLSLPVNLLIHVGTGIVYTQQEYEKLDGSGKTAVLTSQDPYYKVGLSLEFSPFPSYFLDGGVDYYLVRYQDENLKSLRYYCLVGVRL